MMTGSEPRHSKPGEAGTESREAKSSFSGGLMGDPRLSASKLADANEGSRTPRRPWVWALAWIGGFAGAVAIFILIVR